MRYRINKKPSRWRALISLVVVVAAAALYIVFFGKGSVEVPALRQNQAVSGAENGQGERLIIESLGIDADVNYVSVDKDGNMDTPRNGQDTAWYKLGTYPGRAGNAAITGHVDYNDADGVFADLDQLKTGDEVKFRDKEGKTLVFKVVGSEEFEPEAAPRQRIFGSSDEPKLNLITCSGSWNKEANQYSKRLVIFTELVR